MNYKKFLKIQNLTSKMLFALNILKRGNIILEINNDPDYDISDYKREVDDNYYFQNHWNFNKHFENLISIRFAETQIYDASTLNELSKEFDFPYDWTNSLDLLAYIHTLNSDSFSERGFPIDSDSFTLNHLRVRGVDNTKKKLWYEGSFFGNYTTFSGVSDFAIFSLCEYVAVPVEIVHEEFFKSLIAESYVLFLSHNYKMAFFIGYSAIENFVYSFHPDADGEKDRFDDKLKDLFKSRFLGFNLNDHEIYTSIINDFKPLTVIRNNIAHGRADFVSPNDVQVLLNFILTLIITLEYRYIEFDELVQKISFEAS